MNQWDSELIQSLEDSHRKGEIQRLKKFFKQLNLSKIPRKYKVPVASLARRNFLFYTALKILNPLVRPKYAHQDPPLDIEKIEYAASLVNIGSNSEALSLLESIDKSAHPRAHLSEAFLYIAQWDYQKSIPPLREYIVDQKISPYEQLIGELNLAAALVVVGEFQEAEALLKDLIEKCKESNYLILTGNSLEVLGQSYIATKKFKKARQTLEAAATELKAMKNWNELFIEKWNLILDLHENNLNPEKLKREIKRIKNKSANHGHWETIRELDLYSSILTPDRNLYFNLYFSTPFAGYREKMNVMAPDIWTPPNEYIVGHNPVKKPKLVLDVASGESLTGDSYFQKGKNLHHLFHCLCRDLYRPQKLGEIHSAVYEGEYFNPDSTPDKIYQLVKRMRQHLTKHKLQIQINESHGSYKIELPNTIGLKKTLHEQCAMEPFDYKMLELTKVYGDSSEIKAKQICEDLKISRTECLRLLKWGMDLGQIKKEGKGPATKYYLKVS